MWKKPRQNCVKKESMITEIYNLSLYPPFLIITSVSWIWTNLTWLDLVMRFGFRFKQIFTSVPAASKNDAQFKSGLK